MRIATLYRAFPALLAMAGFACQSAQRPAAMLPAAQANAPALLASAPAPAPPAAEQTPAVKTPAPPAPEPAPDPVAELIASVEKEYAAGQQNFSAGHLEAAKLNFNRAFDLLFTSPESVRNDARFKAEFDRVLDGVNGLELQALQEGDGFTEQQSEPAPIDEANDTTFPVDPGIKAKAEAEVKSTNSDLPLMMTDQVAGYINFYSSPRGRGVLERALTRAGRYR